MVRIYRGSSYNYEDMMKKAKYRALLYKMQSILNKSKNLDNRLDTLKTGMKTCLIIDDKIYKESEYDQIDRNIETLNADINSTINTIKSNI